jgi:hypothetical protein
MRCGGPVRATSMSSGRSADRDRQRTNHSDGAAVWVANVGRRGCAQLRFFTTGFVGLNARWAVGGRGYVAGMSGTLTIEARRCAVAAATASLVGLAGSMFAVGNAELGPFFRQVDVLSRQVEAARVAILAEALGRGVVSDSDAPSAAAWVIQWAPSFHAGGAAQLVTVAHATRAVRNVALAAAVLGARVGVCNAAVVLAEMDKLRPRLRDEALEAVWDGFLAIATDHGPKEIRCLRDKLIATYGQQGEFQLPPRPAQTRRFAVPADGR